MPNSTQKAAERNVHPGLDPHGDLNENGSGAGACGGHSDADHGSADDVAVIGREPAVRGVGPGRTGGEGEGRKRGEYESVEERSGNAWVL